MLVDHDHIGWKSWKLIVHTISPTSSLFIAQRSSTYSQGNMEKFWGENIRSTPMSITSGWIESSSTESHVILGGGVAVCVCLLLSHHVVIFAIGQLSCYICVCCFITISVLSFYIFRKFKKVNFIKISQTVLEIWFFIFQNGCRPPSGILKLSQFYWLMGSRGPRCIILLYFIKISKSIVEISWFFD